MITKPTIIKSDTTITKENTPSTTPTIIKSDTTVSDNNVVKKETHIKPLNQQVQIGASSMILLGLALYLFVTPWGLLLPLFAGLGLMNAGVTGVCGMSKLLVRMPWNK